MVAVSLSSPGRPVKQLVAHQCLGRPTELQEGQILRETCQGIQGIQSRSHEWQNQKGWYHPRDPMRVQGSQSVSINSFWKFAFLQAMLSLRWFPCSESHFGVSFCSAGHSPQWIPSDHRTASKMQCLSVPAPWTVNDGKTTCHRPK